MDTFHSNKKLLVVILNRNETELTLRCIESFAGQIADFGDILVIDNQSIIDRGATLKKCIKNLLYVRYERNLGVAGGRNVGIRFAIENRYRFVLLFDNDAYADHDMLTILIDAAERNRDAAIFGPKILCAANRNLIWRAGCTSWRWTYLHSIANIFRKLLGHGKRLPPIFDTVRGEFQEDNGQYDKEEDIDFQIGCAQLIRIEIFQKIGLLDEEYNPYGSEDIDFCARVKKAGWKIRYVPKARCWHRVGGSFRGNYSRSYYNLKNLILLARKNLAPIYFYILFLPDMLLFTVPLMLIESIVTRNRTKRDAIVDALRWHINDVKNRGVII